MVRSGHLITLIKCLKGHKSLEPLCNVKIKISLSDLLSCSGQLKSISMHLFFPPYDQINSDDQRETKDGSDDYGGDIRESV